MAKILYEPSSIRDDFGILHMTEGESCNIPFLFEIKYKDSAGKLFNYVIKDDDVIEFTIKRNAKNITPVIDKFYNKVVNNVAVLSISLEDAKLLLGDCEYVLSAKLYYNNNKSIKVLIKKLQIKIDEVA